MATLKHRLKCRNIVHILEAIKCCNKIVKNISEIALIKNFFCRISNTERHKIIQLIVKKLGSITVHKKTFW